MSGGDPRDRELDGLYRETATETAPARLDAAIRTRARETAGVATHGAVGHRAPLQPLPGPAAAAADEGARMTRDADDRRAPRPEVEPDDDPPTELWPMRAPHGVLLRWRVPIAVAATLVVAGSLVFLMPAGERTDVGLATPDDARTVAARSPHVAADDARLGAKGSAAASGASAASDPSPQTELSAAPPAPAANRAGGPASGSDTGREPTTASATAARASAEREVSRHAASETGDGRTRQSAAPTPLAPRVATDAEPPGTAAGERGAVGAKAPDASDARGLAESATPLAADETPEALVERIRTLRRAGRQDEARKLVAELVARHPAYPLPEDLRDLR